MDYLENKKRRRIKKDIIYIIACIICLILGLFGGYFIHSKTSQTITESSIYDKVVEYIEDLYLDTTDSETEISERILSGMVSALGDPFSSYLTSEETDALNTSIDGSVEGIGVSYTTVVAGALIMHVYQDGPAGNAGIQNGDIITHVAGTSIAGYSSDKIKNIVQGTSGTSVTLKVLRNGKSMEFTLTRASVETSVYGEVRTLSNQSVGYLQITTFGSTSASLIEEYLKEFTNANVNAIIIDLRGNGGGYLNAVMDILDLFIDEGETMFSIADVDNNTTVYEASDREKYSFDKGYILVDSSTASASEVMSAGLKENLNYVLVGETTYGKGIVQTQITLSDGSTLKLTTQKWLTPDGNWIQGEGITPDYEVDDVTLSDFSIPDMDDSYQYDDVDDNISYMQLMLKQLGYDIDRTDGYFSKDTETIYKQFESDYELEVDGVFDEDDATILLSALAYQVYQQQTDYSYEKVGELLK
ncbi:MAG: S41 family peptidase [Erysipelotrichaceae bacterium]|nr:S41 family peptidase [Erysipelotrichaceae bacterium]